MKIISSVMLLALCQIATAHAADRSCKFILGYAEPRPAWFTVSGDATLHASNGKLEVQMFDERMEGKLSHQLTGTLKGGRVNGTMRNLFSDEGKNTVAGSYALSRYTDGKGPHVIESVVVGNPFLFIAVTCHESGT